MNKNVEIKILKIAELKEYKKNPIKHTQFQIEALKNSIREFGFLNPVIVNKNKEVLAGHGRLKALRELGETECLCVIADLNNIKARAFRLADNRIADLKKYEEDLLAEEIKAIMEDIDLTQFQINTGKALKSIEDEIDEPKELKPQEIIEPITQEGDIWVLGKHKLLCGDSTIPDNYKKLLGDEKCHMCFTDPPYNVDYEHKLEHIDSISKQRAKTKINNDKKEIKAFEVFLKTVFGNIYNHIYEGGAFYCCYANSQTLPFLKSYIEAGFYMSSIIIWLKGGIVMGRSDYSYQYEPILYGWKKGKSHRFFGGLGQSNVWKYNKKTQNTLHPTMKPVPIVAKAILNSTRKGELVLEPFAGGGSTIIACEKTGRICRAIELDRTYCDSIVYRYAFNFGEENIYLLRANGEKISYSELKSEFEKYGFKIREDKGEIKN